MNFSADMIFKKQTKCDQVLEDLSRITALVNGKMHMSDLHRKVNIFFYVDRSIQARELCSRLQLKPDEEITKQLAELHKQINDQWAVDRKVLLPETNIVL